MANHHPKSPSTANIWSKCVGAPNMWEHAPRLFSRAANDGIAAHQVLDQCLKIGVKPSFFKGGVFAVDGESIEIDDDIIEALDKCLLIISNYHVTWWGCEVKINIPQIEEGYYGYADFVAYNEATGKLIILDFKYGRVTVPVVDNVQLMLYAMGASSLPNIGTIESVELCIVQPKDFFMPIKREFIEPNHLTKWAKYLKQQYEASKNPNAPRVAGSHCKYCSGKVQCPEYLLAVQDVPEPPFELSPERIEYLLDICSTADRALTEFKQIALNFQQQGKLIPNRKVVRKVTHRKFDNEAVVLDLLKADKSLKPEQYLTEKLKGVGDLDKLGKDYIKQHLVKPEGALELVTLTDSRPAVSTASQHFTKLTK